MAEAELGAVELEIFIEAPPATVFEFFVDPQLMRTWMGGHALLEPLAGGTFAVDIGANHARGQFLEVVPTEKVVFTWGWEGSETVPPGSSTVTVTFESAGGEATMVRLIHQGLPAGEDLRHRHGWTLYLSRLTQAAAGLDPGPDPHPQNGTPLHETS
ncbi:MAG TPA: SRPBCC family protein [Acidimicrobiia bacterium]|nr:SRPBCC family protein [Acidimicrobiia bacterium]